MISDPGRLQGSAAKILIVGGSGRLGALLRQAWVGASGVEILWQARRGEVEDAVRFDPLTEPEKYRNAARGASAILNLAGSVIGGEAEMIAHGDLAIAACEAAVAAGVPQVFLASSAAVYGSAARPHREGDPTVPCSRYGRAKLDMEARARRWHGGIPDCRPAVTCLRIGNVAGADSLLGGIRRCSRPELDVFPDGKTTQRSYIGPRTLSRVLSELFVRSSGGAALPAILNVALRGSVTMAALATAAGLRWSARPAPASAIPVVSLDVTRLASILPVPAGTSAQEIVADLHSVSVEGCHAA